MKRRIPIVGLILSMVPASSYSQDAAPESSAPVVEVATSKVTLTTLHRSITAYGLIEPEPAVKGQPAAIARLSPALPGIISEADGIEGQAVGKGDVLFRLDSRAADAALAKAEMAVTFAQKNAERQRLLIKAEGTSKKNLLEAEQALSEAQSELATAKVNLSLLHGTAPLSGTLTQFTARLGEAADTTTLLAEIIDLNRLVATVQLPRSEAAELVIGQKAQLRASNESPLVSATVSFISPQVNPANNSVTVRLSITGKSALLPGQFVAAAIVVEEKPNRLAVPREAIYTDPKGESTLSIVSDGVSKIIAVKTGLHDGGLIEVEGTGIQQGLSVITTGSYALPDGTKIAPSIP
jgi:membrane fusion protein (multidrug efflux system)